MVHLRYIIETVSVMQGKRQVEEREKNDFIMFSLVTYVADHVDNYSSFPHPGQTICGSSNTWWRSDNLVSGFVLLYCVVIYQVYYIRLLCKKCCGYLKDDLCW